MCQTYIASSSEGVKWRREFANKKCFNTKEEVVCKKY
jgi:hypothetical protein